MLDCDWSSDVCSSDLDCFLMPSRFEPCGLNQLYSLRYGTVPIVHRTGGLADTVVDATPRHLEAGVATGFRFEHANADGLWYAIRQALALRGRSLDEWRRLAVTGMGQDFSWQASAQRYAALYQELLAEQPSTRPQPALVPQPA
jgi:starch synthase